MDHEDKLARCTFNASAVFFSALFSRMFLATPDTDLFSSFCCFSLNNVLFTHLILINALACEHLFGRSADQTLTDEDHRDDDGADNRELNRGFAVLRPVCDKR